MEWLARRLPELVDAAAGVLNNGTGAAVASSSLSQVGSITKVWTATLVVQLANEGPLGHTGLTMGYQSVLRVIPDAGVAVAVLTNGGRAMPAAQEIYDHVLGELVGVELPRFPTPRTAPVSAAGCG